MDGPKMNVAFIPLRAGGKRIGKIGGVDKERALLGGHPLLAYTIRAAIDSEVFDHVIGIVRSKAHARLAATYGAEIPWRRPVSTTEDQSPDIDWVRWALREFERSYWESPDTFAILRVTSPFRGPEVIQLAWSKFCVYSAADSLRTVRPVTEHPGKMWVIRDEVLMPLFPIGPQKQPWYSSPTQSLFDAYIQTAGMEFVRTEVVHQTQSIAGSNIVPFVVDEWEGFDLNTRRDWEIAEKAVRDGEVKLPEVE